MESESNSPSDDKRNIGQGSIVALGNVLLDIITSVDLTFLENCGLRPDTTTLAGKESLQIFTRVQTGEQFKVTYSAGGCAANTARIAQWILGSPSDSRTIFVGAVGDDIESKKLLELLGADGVIGRCQNVPNSPTGRCLVLTHGVSRTLLTQLGASTQFNHDKFMDLDFEYVSENSGVIYISGYFLRVCSQTVRCVAEMAVKKKIPVVLNLNAVWVVEAHFKEIIEILPYVDYIMGNELEAMAMSKMLKLFPNSGLMEMGKYISQLAKNSEHSRVVLITRGKEPLIVVQGEEILHCPTFTVPDSAIVDTNGAGDAFAGGFLVGLLRLESLSSCIKRGLWAASEIIQQSGCNFQQNSYYTS